MNWKDYRSGSWQNKNPEEFRGVIREDNPVGIPEEILKKKSGGIPSGITSVM